jgi:hypothetical protein
MSNESNESNERKDTFVSVIKHVEERCSVWKNKLTEQGLEDNTAEKELCSFLGHVLTQVESKIQDCDKVDNKEDSNLTEVVEEKLAVPEAKKEAKKKVKGEDSEKKAKVDIRGNVSKVESVLQRKQDKDDPKS